MSCSSCGAGFGFLKKEVGCEKCGFSFCSHCCKKQEVSDNSGKTRKIVCQKCFKQLISDAKTMDEVGNISPPLAHKKRMEALKNKSYSVDSQSHARMQWSNATDKAIAERLQHLKRDRFKNLPTEEEIQKRLALLKGMDPARYNAPPIEVFRPDKRTSLEKACDLMKQMTEEARLDSKIIKPEHEIADRLAALRNQTPKNDGKSVDSEVPVVIASPDAKLVEEMDLDEEYLSFKKDSETISSSVTKEIEQLNVDSEYRNILSSMQHKKNESDDEHEMTDEEEADKLVEKLLATNMDDVEELDYIKDDNTETSSSFEEQLEEEFPWCTICNEDAKIRCFGCDSDLYCMRCFRECHDSLDIRDHKTCPYLRKSTAL